MKISSKSLSDSYIDFVWRNIPGTFMGVVVLLLDVSVKMEIIDFPQPRIKQKLVIGIDYVQPYRHLREWFCYKHV